MQSDSGRITREVSGVKRISAVCLICRQAYSDPFHNENKGQVLFYLLITVIGWFWSSVLCVFVKVWILTFWVLGLMLLPATEQLKTSSGSAVVPWRPLWCHTSDGRRLIEFRFTVLLAAIVTPFISCPVCRAQPAGQLNYFTGFGHFTLLPPATSTVLRGSHSLINRPRVWPLTSKKNSSSDCWRRWDGHLSHRAARNLTETQRCSELSEKRAA